MAIRGYVGANISYTPVEYIQSSGNQYIDTDILLKRENRLEMDVQFTTIPSTVAYINGGYDYDTNNVAYRNDIGIVSSKFWFGVWQQSVNVTAADTARHSLFTDCYTGDYGMDGQTLGNITTTASSSTLSSKLILFARQSNQKNIIQFCNQKLYSCKIYTSGVLVRDFIPVKDQNNIACLYDKVENKFYYNQGTGNFTAGSTTGDSVIAKDISKKITKAYVGVSTKYTPIEYLESTGNQYIDTGFKHNNYTRMVAKVNYSNSGIWTYPFGSFGGASGTNKLFCAEINNNLKLGTYYGTHHLFSIDADGTHTYDLNKNVHTIDNTSYTYSTTTFQSEYNTLIFAATDYTGGSTGKTTHIKLYYFKIYYNDVLQRDFIPVLDENNIPCLYDLVGKKFYYNQGTGDFVAGPTTGDMVEINNESRKIKKGYIGVNGIAKLCYYYGPLSKKVLSFTSARGYGIGIASTDNRIIAAGGANSLTNFESWDRNYTKTTTSASNYSKDCTGRSFNKDTFWIFSNQTNMQIIHDNLTTNKAGRYSNNTSKYGIAGCEIGNYMLFTGGVGGASATACAYNYAGTLTSPTAMYGSRFRHAQCNFNNRACILGGGSTYMDVYSENLTRTYTTGLAADRRYINAEATKDYLICGQQNYLNVAVFDNNLVRQNALLTPMIVTTNATAFKEPHGNYVAFLNNATHCIINNNLTTETFESKATFLQDTYQTPWYDGKVAVASSTQVEIFDT